MFYGATYVNFTKDKELFTQMDKFMPPVMCVFFALSGAGMSVSSLSAAGAIAVAFFLARIVGKVGGCFIGSVIARASKPVKRWMGFTMLPQASVSIGLAALAATVLSPSLGELVSGVVISSAVLYELIGPALSKLALIKSGSIGSALPPLGIAVSKVEGDWDKPESTEEDWQKPTGIPRYDVGSSFEVHDPLVGHIPPYEKPIGAIKWKKSPPKQDE